MSRQNINSKITDKMDNRITQDTASNKLCFQVEGNVGSSSTGIAALPEKKVIQSFIQDKSCQSKVENKCKNKNLYDNKKYNFTLKNINCNNVEEKYNLYIICNQKSKKNVSINNDLNMYNFFNNKQSNIELNKDLSKITYNKNNISCLKNLENISRQGTVSSSLPGKNSVSRQQSCSSDRVEANHKISSVIVEKKLNCNKERCGVTKSPKNRLGCIDSVIEDVTTKNTTLVGKKVCSVSSGIGDIVKTGLNNKVVSSSRQVETNQSSRSKDNNNFFRTKFSKENQSVLLSKQVDNNIYSRGEIALCRKEEGEVCSTEFSRNKLLRGRELEVSCCIDRSESNIGDIVNNSFELNNNISLLSRTQVGFSNISKIPHEKICFSRDRDLLSENNSTYNNFIEKTSINELKKDSVKFFTYLDEKKKIHKCHIVMIDFKSKEKLKGYNCYWCRHIIPDYILPIGCPLRYIHSKITKKYKSELSKDKYTIREDICKLDSICKDNISKDNKDYYLTDGIFCSFGCVKSYIKDNIHNSLYNNSSSLLIKLYNDINNIDINEFDSDFKITEAPDWRLLKSYGGHLSINEFRKGLNSISWKTKGYSEPYFLSLQHLFEKKIVF